MTGTIGDLLCLREEFVDVAIKFKLSNVPDRHLIFRPDLGCIKDVKVKIVFLIFRNDLNPKVPLWVSPVVDCFHEVLPMEVRILSGQLESLIPHEGMDTQVRRKVELDEMPLASGIYELESIDAKSLHHPV